MNVTPPKIEFVTRKLDKHIVLAGVLVTDGFKVGELASMELYGRIEGDKIRIRISKEMSMPQNEYGDLDAEVALGDLMTTECWRHYKSNVPTEFGGLIIGRDNFLFDFEDPDSCARVAVVSVLGNASHLFECDEIGHSVIRSVEAIEYSDCFEFLLVRDVTPETQQLADQMRGDAFSNAFRKPFYTLPDGSKYRLHTVLPKKSNEALERQNKEIIDNGSVSEETKQLLREQWLLIHSDTDYLDFLKEMAAAGCDLCAKYNRLLTEAECKKVDELATAVMRRQMGE